jgi:hypothetical protein
VAGVLLVISRSDASSGFKCRMSPLAQIPNDGVGTTRNTY